MSTRTPSTASQSRRRASSDRFNPLLRLGSTASLSDAGPSVAPAIGDFNRDDQLDLAIAIFGSASSTNLAVFAGSGSGTFDDPTELTVGSDPVAIVVADFNGDGNSDIATANRGANRVSVLLGNGNGSFRRASTFRVGSRPRGMAVGDLNGDGRSDLVTANTSDDSVSVLLGQANGRFRRAGEVELDEDQPVAIATGDFDEDDRLDLVVVNAGTSSVSLLLGNGRGGFDDPEDYRISGATPAAIAVGDFDEDNNLDVATANLGTGSNRNVSILFGNGRGRFKSELDLSAGGRVSSIATVDFDGDGNLDLATTLYDSATVRLLLGDGDGSFSSSSSAARTVVSSPSGIATGDLNDDGKPDLIVTSNTSRNASIVLNRTPYVFLDPPDDDQDGRIDGSQESDSSITVDLSEDELTINTSSAVNLTVRNYIDVDGTQRRDVITGNGDRNTLNGNGGNDSISGLANRDTLSGGAGNDSLSGGSGDDQLSGGLGSDTLTGGDGSDQFIVDTSASFATTAGRDTFTDFRRGQDKIILDRTTFPALRQFSFATVADGREAGRSTALITYVRSTGGLYYNADGDTAGFGTGGLFAVLRNSTSASGALSAADFQTRA